MPVTNYLEFAHLPSYHRSTEGLIDDEAQREIEAALVGRPEAGAVIVGTGAYESFAFRWLVEANAGERD